MNAQSLKKIKAWFPRYIRGQGKLHRMMKLKVAHSVRVALECRGVAAEAGFSDADIRLGEAVGLLHDIARFPQFKTYGTFIDRRSVDHGDFGAQIFREDSELMQLLESDMAQVIHAAIQFHNKRDVPTHVQGRILQFVELVRDGDKLDIFRVITETIETRRYEQEPEILLDIDPKGPLNPALVRDVRREHRGSYDDVRSVADWTLLMMAWVYNLNYLPALNRLMERGYLDRLAACMPPDPEVADVVADMKHFIHEKQHAGRLRLHGPA